jgi:endonuclease/exonuclease/phosphatase family metal-dependent hydrolase
MRTDFALAKWPWRRLCGAAVPLLLSACASLPGPARERATALRVMTFNIRYDEPADGADAWPFRKKMAAGTISFHRVDIAGLQEVLASQLHDLQSLLPEYAWVGVGRDDGRAAGEHNPLFFLRDRFRLLASATFWLSEEPGKAGVKGWDAACPRIVTWARLEDLWTGEILVAFNTHFDHIGVRARNESAALVLAAVRKIAGRDPAILTGDLNCTREDQAYLTLIAAEDGVPLLRDTRDESLRRPFGPASSFNGFRTEPRAGLPIDHVFVSGAFETLRAGILPGWWDGRFVSDHNPVLAEVQIAR